MNSISTRTVCAVLSMMGAAGLVTFVDSANAVGAARHQPATAVVAAASSAVVAQRG